MKRAAALLVLLRRGEFESNTANPVTQLCVEGAFRWVLESCATVAPVFVNQEGLSIGSRHDAKRTIRTATARGRYAEVFSYDDKSGMLFVPK